MTLLPAASLLIHKAAGWSIRTIRFDRGRDWCRQATVTPKRGHVATIEVFFEKPEDGKPGAAFAFRAVADTKAGPDYMRGTCAFEANWKDLQVPGFEIPANQDCD